MHFTYLHVQGIHAQHIHAYAHVHHILVYVCIYILCNFMLECALYVIANAYLINVNNN